MASLLELGVSTGKWDAGLRKAQASLNTFIDANGGLSEALQKESGQIGTFVQMMGKMESTAKTARGQMNDYKNVLEQLTGQYNKMTDAQKASIGQEYLKTIDELKKKYQEASGQAAELNRSLTDTGDKGRSTGGVMDTLASKFSLNVDVMKLLNVGLKAASGALSVVKDAFSASEASIDEWGRVTESAKSLYNGFLTALNTGDISGYLSRINDIVNAARTAYDELDRLGTLKTIQTGEKSAQEAENTRMRMMLTTGRYIAPLEGKGHLWERGLQNGQELSDGLLKMISGSLDRGMGKLTELVTNEVEQSTRAIEAEYKRQGLEIGLSQSEFKRGTSSMTEFDARLEGARMYRQWEREHTTYDPVSGIGHRDRSVNPYAQYRGWSEFRDSGEAFNKLVQLIQQRDQQKGQVYQMYGQTYRSMNRADARITGGSGGGSVTAEVKELTGLIEKQEEKIKNLRDAWRKATSTEDIVKQRRELKYEEIQLDILKGKIPGGVGMPGATGTAFDMKGALKTMEARMAKTLEETMPDGARTVSVGQSLGQMASGINSVVSGIQQLGIEIPAGFQKAVGAIQTVATILGGISSVVTVIAAIQGTKAIPIIGWTLARGGMVRAAGGYSVPGNHLSGDMVPAMLNSQELVLNKAQSGIISNLLENGGMQAMEMDVVITGEDLRLVRNRNSRRRGYGERMTIR